MDKKQSKCYRIDTEKVVWRIIDAEIVILNLDSGRYYSLNKTGSFVWSLLDEKKTGQEVIERICREYGIARNKASRDVVNIIKDLEKEGLVSAVR